MPALSTHASGHESLRLVHRRDSHVTFGERSTQYYDPSGPVAIRHRSRTKNRPSKGLIAFRLWGFNSNGKPQLTSLLDEIKNLEASGLAPRCLAVCGQETWQGGEKWPLFVEHLARKKWYTIGSPARVTGPRTAAAGVCITTPQGKARLAPIPGHTYDFSPSGEPGRVTACWVVGEKERHHYRLPIPGYQ